MRAVLFAALLAVAVVASAAEVDVDASADAEFAALMDELVAPVDEKVVRYPVTESLLTGAPEDLDDDEVAELDAGLDLDEYCGKPDGGVCLAPAIDGDDGVESDDAESDDAKVARATAVAAADDVDDEHDWATKNGLGSFEDIPMPPEPRYRKWSAKQVRSDAARLCTAMKGWGTDEKAVNSIVFSTKRSFEHLKLVKAAFASTRCASGGSLVKWIKGDFSCAEKTNLVDALTSPAKKLALDREKMLAGVAKSKKPTGDTELVNKEMTALSFSQQDGVLKSCGKGLAKGVKFAVEGYIEMAKMGWKAMKSLVTDPVGSLQKVGCAVKSAGKWLWKKTKQAASWIRKKSARWMKGAWRDFKHWAAKPCATGPLFCVFEKALRAPFDLFGFVAKKVISAIVFVYKNTIGKHWAPLSMKRKINLICWTVGFVGIELAMIPIVPFVFGFLARKLATVTDKVLKLIGKLPGVSSSALRRSMVGRWTSKQMVKSAKLKETAAMRRAGKASDKLEKARKSGASQKQLAKLEKQQMKANTKAMSAADDVVRHEKTLAAGMQKLAEKDARRVVAMKKSAAALDREALELQHKIANGKASAFTEKRLAFVEHRSSKLKAQARTFDEAMSSGKGYLTHADRAQLRRSMKQASAALRGPSVIAYQIGKLGTAMRWAAKQLDRFAFVRSARKTAGRMNSAMKDAVKQLAKKKSSLRLPEPLLKGKFLVKQSSDAIAVRVGKVTKAGKSVFQNKVTSRFTKLRLRFARARSDRLLKIARAQSRQADAFLDTAVSAQRKIKLQLKMAQKKGSSSTKKLAAELEKMDRVVKRAQTLNRSAKEAVGRANHQVRTVMARQRACGGCIETLATRTMVKRTAICKPSAVLGGGAKALPKTLSTADDDFARWVNWLDEQAYVPTKSGAAKMSEEQWRALGYRFRRVTQKNLDDYNAAYKAHMRAEPRYYETSYSSYYTKGDKWKAEWNAWKQRAPTRPKEHWAASGQMREMADEIADLLDAAKKACATSTTSKQCTKLSKQASELVTKYSDNVKAVSSGGKPTIKASTKRTSMSQSGRTAKSLSYTKKEIDEVFEALQAQAKLGDKSKYTKEQWNLLGYDRMSVTSKRTADYEKALEAWQRTKPSPPKLDGRLTTGFGPTTSDLQRAHHAQWELWQKARPQSPKVYYRPSTNARKLADETRKLVDDALAACRTKADDCAELAKRAKDRVAVYADNIEAVAAGKKPLLTGSTPNGYSVSQVGKVSRRAHATKRKARSLIDDLNAQARLGDKSKYTKEQWNALGYERMSVTPKRTADYEKALEAWQRTKPSPPKLDGRLTTGFGPTTSDLQRAHHAQWELWQKARPQPPKVYYRMNGKASEFVEKLDDLLIDSIKACKKGKSLVDCEEIAARATRAYDDLAKQVKNPTNGPLDFSSTGYKVSSNGKYAARMSRQRRVVDELFDTLDEQARLGDKSKFTPQQWDEFGYKQVKVTQKRLDDFDEALRQWNLDKPHYTEPKKLTTNSAQMGYYEYKNAFSERHRLWLDAKPKKPKMYYAPTKKATALADDVESAIKAARDACKAKATNCKKLAEAADKKAAAFAKQYDDVAKHADTCVIGGVVKRNCIPNAGKASSGKKTAAAKTAVVQLADDLDVVTKFQDEFAYAMRNDLIDGKTMNKLGWRREYVVNKGLGEARIPRPDIRDYRLQVGYTEYFRPSDAWAMRKWERDVKLYNSARNGGKAQWGEKTQLFHWTRKNGMASKDFMNADVLRKRLADCISDPKCNHAALAKEAAKWREEATAVIKKIQDSKKVYGARKVKVTWDGMPTKQSFTVSTLGKEFQTLGRLPGLISKRQAKISKVVGELSESIRPATKYSQIHTDSLLKRSGLEMVHTPRDNAFAWVSKPQETWVAVGRSPPASEIKAMQRYHVRVRQWNNQYFTAKQVKGKAQFNLKKGERLTTEIERASKKLRKAQDAYTDKLVAQKAGKATADDVATAQHAVDDALDRVDDAKDAYQAMSEQSRAYLKALEESREAERLALALEFTERQSASARAVAQEALDKQLKKADQAYQLFKEKL